MQQSVTELIKLGPLPSEQDPDVDVLKQYQDLLEAIKTPISDDEAIALTAIFGDDDCFGLTWTLLHIIETAPGWPIKEALKNTGNEWINTLISRSS